MANFIVDDLKRTFNGNNNLSKILIINVVVFIVLNLILVFGDSAVDQFMLNALALPSGTLDVLTHFWTLLTYQFTHEGLFHLVVNLLWLYWIGKIFIEFQGHGRFLTLYLLGGLSGGLVYILIGLIPGVYGGATYLIGASGAVLAIVVATATLVPDYTIRLLFIGPVKLKYLAVGAIVLTTILNLNDNTGGKMAHLGGAIFGYFYIRQLQNGVNLGAPFENFVARLRSTFQKQPKMKVQKGGQQYASRDGSKASSKNDQARVDEILDKISKSGYDSLSKEEKDFLFRMSNN